jgi:hypothetical protein
MHTQPDKIGRANYRYAFPLGVVRQPCSPVAVVELFVRLGMIALAMLQLAACASPPNDGVSLSITSATAQRKPDMLDIWCDAALDNHTDAPLVVTSNGSSAFDGLTLLVRDVNDRLLAQQSFLFHQSPDREGKHFTLRVGRNTHHMGFPLFTLTNAPSTLRLQLVGTLPGSGYHTGLTSQVFRVTVKEVFVERKDGQQDYARAIAAVNRQIEKINEEPKVIKTDQRVVRIEYSAQDGRVICFDKTGKGFLTLERRESGRFEGVFTTPAISFVFVKGHGAPASMSCPIYIEEKDLP